MFTLRITQKLLTTLLIILISISFSVAKTIYVINMKNNSHKEVAYDFVYNNDGLENCECRSNITSKESRIFSVSVENDDDDSINFTLNNHEFSFVHHNGSVVIASYPVKTRSILEEPLFVSYINQANSIKPQKKYFIFPSNIIDVFIVINPKGLISFHNSKGVQMNILDARYFQN